MYVDWTAVGKIVAVGGALFYGVMKFFDAVGGRLNEGTKKEIARWLRIKNVETGIVADEAVNWPETFAEIFGRVFGAKHLSWKCFSRSVFASVILGSIGLIAALAPFGIRPFNLTPRNPGAPEWQFVVLVCCLGLFFIVFVNIIPDYISLLETRLILHFMKRRSSGWWLFSLLVVDFGVTGCTGLLFYSLSLSGVGVITGFAEDKTFWSYFAGIAGAGITHSPRYWAVYPAFFTSIWLWLYAGSGFLLKAARRFDLGFDWFNRKFDIEKKPLQSIGLVAGALVAVVYWTAVIVSRVIG